MSQLLARMLFSYDTNAVPLDIDIHRRSKTNVKPYRSNIVISAYLTGHLGLKPGAGL